MNKTEIMAMSTKDAIAVFRKIESQVQDIFADANDQLKRGEKEAQAVVWAYLRELQTIL